MSAFTLFFTSSVVSDGARIYTLSDDIMISMSYAKTFINSGELIWYDGSPRVQGFTNFLYTIFLSFIHLFKFDLPINSLIVSIVNVIFILIISSKVTSLSLLFSNGNEKNFIFLRRVNSVSISIAFLVFKGIYEVGIISLLLILIVEQIVKFDPSFERTDHSKF